MERRQRWDLRTDLEAPSVERCTAAHGEAPALHAADFELAYASGPCAGATHCTVAQQAVTTLAIPVRCHPAARGVLTSQIGW